MKLHAEPAGRAQIQEFLSRESSSGTWEPEREAAAWARSVAITDLGIPTFPITFFEIASAAEYVESERHGRRADFIEFDHALVGQAHGGAAWRVLIRAGLTPAETARVTFHESRHLHQKQDGRDEQEDELDSVDDFVKRVQAYNPRRSVQQIRGSILHNLKQLPSGKWTWKYDKVLRSRRRTMRPGPATAQRLWKYAESLQCPTLVVRGAETDVVAAEPQVEHDHRRALDRAQHITDLG